MKNTTEAHTKKDCLFCKIARKEIPSDIVYEDDDVICFNDLNPQALVHVLVVPKVHYDHILDGTDAVSLDKLLHGVKEVVRAKNLDDGFRLITNKGKDAGQTVEHLHIHVLGGTRLGEKMA